MTSELEGKVFLVTGATDGMGKVAAREFSRRGVTVVLIGRNPDKTAKTRTELEAETGNPRLETIVCDLSRNAEVRRAAEEFKARHDRLDVLVNNAGAVFKAQLRNADGIEQTFALNHMGPFQLTVSLMDLLRATPGARVVTTSSAMQARGKLDLARTPDGLNGSGTLAYATSKLCNILFTKELQRRLEGTGVVANCFEPGNVRTQFGGYGSTDLGLLINLVYRMAARFAITPEQGADSLIWLATSLEAASLQGEYVSKRRVVKPSRQALDPMLARGLWERSEELCRSLARQS